jgi:anti-sigma factor RsiW
MTCDDARLRLLDLRRGRLAPDEDRELRAHLETCAGCARARAEEDVVTDLLERRLPVYPAPAALKRRLAMLASAVPSPAEPAVVRRPRRWARIAMPAMAAAASLAIAGTAVLVDRSVGRDRAVVTALTGEAVSDHLRVLQRDRRVDVESGGTHQVKPWFEGKLDFAPSVPAPVAPDMRLEGATVGYFLDRKAAVVVYGLRRHVLTLLVFRGDGLDWPRELEQRERVPVSAAARGFHVFVWRSGGLGYALVGDADPAELAGIAAKLAQST